MLCKDTNNLSFCKIFNKIFFNTMFIMGSKNKLYCRVRLPT